MRVWWIVLVDSRVKSPEWSLVSARHTESGGLTRVATGRMYQSRKVSGHCPPRMVASFRSAYWIGRFWIVRLRCISLKRNPTSPEVGFFHVLCFEPSGFHSSNDRHRTGARIGPGPCPVRRAETSDQSGGFTRVMSGTILQTRIVSGDSPQNSLHFPSIQV